MIVGFIDLVFSIMTLAILGRVLLSWFPAAQGSGFARVLYDVTEPILGPLRRVIPPIGMIDLSPLIAIILLQVLGRILVSSMGGL